VACAASVPHLFFFFFFENAYLTCGYNYNYKGSASARYGLPAEPNKVRQKETVSSPVTFGAQQVIAG